MSDQLVSEGGSESGLSSGMATRLLVAALAGAGALGFWLRQSSNDRTLEILAPRITTAKKSGKFKDIESFGSYVVRQLGLDAESAIADTVRRAAEDYLREDSRKAKSEAKENLLVLVSGETQEEDEKQICDEVLLELELLLVTYFSFHWKHAPAIIEKVVSNGVQMKKLHKAVLNVTRKQRYEKVLQSLSTKRRIHTLIEGMKAMAKDDESVPEQGLVTVPADSSKRCPVILFIGGGMGAGKSTVVKEILSSSFWAGVIKDAVVVEADAFKETDVIYQSLNAFSNGDVSGNSQLVHQFSTDAANSLLVAALNEGRDVIFDGTMSWEPFVVQTMEMVRDIHKRRYRMGRGYGREPSGKEYETYWEPCEDEPKEGQRPYRIEFVGVVCSAHLAVVRGMRRAIATKRGVPVQGQLKSHKMFAKSAEKYVSMVDAAKIFDTSAWNGPAELIAIKVENQKKLLIDEVIFPGVRCIANLNTDAEAVTNLYNYKIIDEELVNQFWQHQVLDPKRNARQERLRKAILDNASASLPLLEKSLTMPKSGVNGSK